MSRMQSSPFNGLLLGYMRSGQNELAKPLLRKELCKVSDNYGTLLHYAVLYNNVWFIESLIKLGSNVNAVGRHGDTPLIIALEKNSSWAVKSLLSANANIHMVGSYGKSPLQLLFLFNDLSDSMLSHFYGKLKNEVSTIDEFIEKLFNAGCKAYHAVHCKDLKVVETLLDRGVHVDSRGYRGKTALMAAAQTNDLEMVKMLLKRGADVNVIDHDGYSALLHCQVSSRCIFANANETILQLLLESGADVNVRSRVRGSNPLFNVYKDAVEVVGNPRTERELDTWAELLLLRDALPQNSNGPTSKTILQLAYEKPNSFRTKLLIAHIAMLELLGTPIIQSLMNSTVEQYRTKYPEFGEYHDLCQQVLMMPIFDSRTLLDLLNESENKIKVYLNNEDFVPKLAQFYREHQLGLQCPLYYKKMEERVSKATRLLELENKAIVIIFKITDSNCHLIAREIISYLNKRDLENFCQIED